MQNPELSDNTCMNLDPDTEVQEDMDDNQPDGMHVYKLILCTSYLVSNLPMFESMRVGLVTIIVYTQYLLII